MGTSCASRILHFAAGMGSNPTLCTKKFGHKKTRKAGNEVDLEIGDTDGCIKRKESSSYYIWQYFTVSNSSDPKKGGAKIAVCKFCDKTFSGCCTSRAAAHILGRSVLGQAKAGIQACIAINKKDDDRRAILKNAQQALVNSY